MFEGHGECVPRFLSRCSKDPYLVDSALPILALNLTLPQVTLSWAKPHQRNSDPTKKQQGFWGVC